MEYKDYYRVLGVSRDADQKDIKKAFRRLARKYHPDVAPGDKASEEKFKEVNEAYEVLSDPEKRKLYDQYGAQWRQWQQAGGRPEDFPWGQAPGQGAGWPQGAGAGGRARGPGYVHYTSAEDLEDLFGGEGRFSDFFQQLFGGAYGRQQPRGGVEDLFGRGYGPTAGRTRARAGQDYEQPVEITLQEAYSGTTRLLQVEDRRLEVKIPPGSDNGTRVRIPGAGGPGMMGGESGDLYLVVKVRDNPRYDRKGDDLYMDMDVALYTVVLGGEVQVPTLGGRSVMLSIPPETRNGQAFRLRDRGMPHLNNPEEHGDLFVTVKVDVPQDLSSRERELFEELQNLSGT
jgi:curved DNA-binding protein